VRLAADGAGFAQGLVPWSVLEEIADAPTACFEVGAGGARELRVFSETTDWVRALWATGSAPTTVVAGFPMHRIQDIDPLEDTRRKLEAAGPLYGEVLDTATGLGYTAIQAARSAAAVVTLELDPAALELARDNPWSAELFSDPKISQLIGDAADLVTELETGRFSAVIHDPPTLKLAGQLYSGEFYRELHRVLRRGGRLFHYVGDPASESGRRTTPGVVRRLQEAGFARVAPAPRAFGVIALR
jgi:predicted methyltransferase